MTAPIRTFLLRLALFALALLPAMPASAAPRLPTCRIATAANVDVATMLARPLAPCPPLSKKTRGTVWLDLGRPAALRSQAEPYRLIIDNHRVRTLDLYVQRADRSVEHIPYDPAAPHRLTRTGGYLSIPIAHRESPVVRMLVRLGDVELITFTRGVRLVPALTDYRSERNHAALYGMAVGMLALTILFHFSLFFAIRRRFQLFYCAHAAMLLIYAASYSGLILFVLPTLSATILSCLITASMAAATATGLLFSIDFIEPECLPRWLRRWGVAGAFASFAAAFVLMSAPGATTNDVYTFASFAGLHGLGLIIAVLVVGLWQRSRAARTLTLGWAIPVGIALLYPLRLLNLVPADIIPDGAMVLSLTLECLILSLPVVDRIKGMRLDHERANERQSLLERQAATDALTGLANRRGFVAALDRAVQLRGGAMPVALLMIDIDNFKIFNDRYGHVRADSILIDLSAHVSRAAGPGAIVARYGGEEFVVALLGLDSKRGATIAERIRAGIEDRGDVLLDATVSIGVACGPCDAIDRLMVEADLALYDAKRGGRNRVSITPTTERAIAA